MALSYNSASFTEHSFGIPTYDEVINDYGTVNASSMVDLDGDSVDETSLPFAFGSASAGTLNRVIYKLRDRVIGVVDFEYTGGNLTRVKRVK
jgi:hypothetical protein